MSWGVVALFTLIFIQARITQQELNARFFQLRIEFVVDLHLSSCGLECLAHEMSNLSWKFKRVRNLPTVGVPERERERERDMGRG